MAVTIGRYRFDGPFTDTRLLENRSGVYVLQCWRQGDYVNIDVGESADVRTRVEHHDRARCWSRNCGGTLSVSALYCGEADRMRVERELHRTQALACGRR